MPDLLDPDGALTLLAPIVAIGLALITKRVIPALGAGAIVAALVARDGHLVAGVNALAGYVYGAVVDLDHLIISAFSVLVAATVGVLRQAGAIHGLVEAIGRLAKGPRGAMVASWLAGGVVFFDDYANCLVVGNTMGPLYDKYKVSRAKLAYIVDSTAAPVASLALVSTWVGYEVGLIDTALSKAGSDLSGFSIFLQALPYRFYSIFALALVGIIAVSGRDFGPMVDEERKARNRPDVVVDDGVVPAPAWMAGVPVLALVVITFGYMYGSGVNALGDAAAGARLFEILGESDPYRAMFTGSASAFVLAVVVVLASREASVAQVVTGTWKGAAMVLEALVVLYLAWTLGSAIDDSGAATYMTGLLVNGLWVAVLPSVVFLLAAGTALATGTSFGTMGILIPLAVPLGLELDPGDGSILAATTAAVLAGACLGDHASPISDTTVLSALGSEVNVATHVRTQLPYALLAGLVAVVLGYLPAGIGLSPWLSIPVGIAFCAGAVMLVGTKTS